MFIVEGTIGAGKSTLLHSIAREFPHISVIQEPVHAWHAQEHSQSLLAQFYNDIHRWSYTMETFTMLSRVREHLIEQAHPDSFRLTERSIYSGHYCFALNGYEQGFFSPVEWQLYMDWFNFLIPGRCQPPQGFIYLSLDPAVAQQRIMHRSRTGEVIPLEYLEQICKKHDQFLLKKEGVLDSIKNVPVLIVDVNDDFEHDKQRAQKICAQIVDFMRECGMRTAVDRTHEVML